MKSPKRIFHFILFLALMYATYKSWSWAWGLLFFYWTFKSIQTRSAYFLDDVSRDEEPVFYWLIIVTWFALSLLLVLMSVPALYPYFYPEFY